MRVPWPARVRTLHLVVFILVLVLVCLNINLFYLKIGIFRAESSWHYQENQSPAIPLRTIYERGHVIVNPQICPALGRDVKLLITVSSAPPNVTARLAIRKTWGHFTMRKDVAIAFVIGLGGRPIDREQDLYGDIIRGRFFDSYDNLTLKTVSMLEWVVTYCPKALFVLKTDDDMFINVSKLLDFISRIELGRRAIYGKLSQKVRPIRERTWKYTVSRKQFSGYYFPDFTSGPAYLFPTHIAKELYEEAFNCTYVGLEDVFVTGIMASALGIDRIHVEAFNVEGRFSICDLQESIISIHEVTTAELYGLWMQLHQRLRNC